mmetsp:Transcript_53502/g.79975  ORF Transcript_53502/g.79975 Transcript_53502/m.79975 type:complete len:280 (+) Transcript_53502:303-1142(+)
MKLSIALLLSAITAEAAFVPSRSNYARTQVVAKGYLDDLQAQMDQGKEEEEEEDDSHEATMMSKDQLDRYGPGSFDGFVDFDEFDGGDGQMGVAGDGSKGLEKMGGTPQFAKSKTMSAKNAWGSSTGYSDSLLERNPKMDVARAQQLENWMNQQEILKAAKEKKFMTDAFDAVNESAEMDWRELAKFGIQRNTESDLDEEFGAVVAGDISGVIDIHTQVNRIESYEISVSSSFDMVKLWLSCFCPTHNSLFLSLKSHPVLPPTLCLHYTHTFFHFSLRL